MTYLRIILLVIVLILNINCSAHCDDEDYAREQNDKKTVHLDTLKPNQVSDNNISIE
jgi:hypothetical protein